MRPTDPGAYVTAAGLLLLVVLVAGWLPARRAGRLDAVRRTELPCVPCGKRICPLGTRACMGLLAVEPVQAVLDDDRSTALYLSPTKALARDQVRALREFRLPQVRAAAYDGDLPRAERDAIRRTANVVLTNPDMLHIGILPNHRRWGDFLHRLELVIVDECHVARGVFGSHVAAILRRLRRICSYYGADPVFALASATIGNPAEHAASLVGAPVEAVAVDGSARPRSGIGLWEPPLMDDQLRTRRSTPAGASEQVGGGPPATRRAVACLPPGAPSSAAATSATVDHARSPFGRDAGSAVAHEWVASSASWPSRTQSRLATSAEAVSLWSRSRSGAGLATSKFCSVPIGWAARSASLGSAAT